MVTPGQLSVAVAAKLTTAEHNPASVFIVMFIGQVMTGSSLSLTVTVKLHVVIFPEASVALY